MADILWSDVVGVTQIANVPPTAQTEILGYVNETLQPIVYGGVDAHKFRLARIYLAAHMAEIGKRVGGIAGAVTSENVAAESISFGYTAPIKGAIEALETTSWGLEFQRLTKSSAYARMPITSSGC